MKHKTRNFNGLQFSYIFHFVICTRNILFLYEYFQRILLYKIQFYHLKGNARVQSYKSCLCQLAPIYVNLSCHSWSYNWRIESNLFSLLKHFAWNTRILKKHLVLEWGTGMIFLIIKYKKDTLIIYNIDISQTRLKISIAIYNSIFYTLLTLKGVKLVWVI